MYLCAWTTRSLNVSDCALGRQERACQTGSGGMPKKDLAGTSIR
jgi:hypothetical protein